MRVPPRALAAVVLPCAVAALAVAKPVRSSAPSPFRQASFDTDPQWDGSEPACGRKAELRRAPFRLRLAPAEP